MTCKVGIPRALLYFQFYPLWKTFLNELGVEVLVSEPTSRKTVDLGVKTCVDEACLPVKLFHGHVLELKDRVDYLFIPRLTSISRDQYICPKFGGLPDMVRQTIPNLGPVIDTEINLRKSPSKAWKSALEIGRYFSDDKRKIRHAYNKAMEAYDLNRRQIREGALPGDLLQAEGKKPERAGPGSQKLNIAILGHIYNLCDSYLNMELIEKLKKQNVNILTAEMLDEQQIQHFSSTAYKRMFWNYGEKALGYTNYLMDLDRGDIQGIIYLMSFGCGIDSFICDLVERRIRRQSNIPFTVITLDEHSGEAGLNTRVEAFIDMIGWRRADEDNISAHG